MADELVVVLALVLLGVGLALARLPVEECAECPHCDRLRRAAERERQRRQEDAMRRDEEQRLLAHRRYHETTGADRTDCPSCNWRDRP